jgi:Holliday junction DNA helicase RuvA
MIYHLNGTLELCEEGSCVIDCNGVGYKLSISDNTYTSIVGNVGKGLKLLTYLQVREDAVELYGFKNSDELSAFKLLITVSGVGPKAAMSILSLLTPDKLSLAICSEDTKTIAKASGVGTKTAARVVLELKDKIKPEDVIGKPVDDEEDSVISTLRQEATEALVALGYTVSDAYKVLQKLDITEETRVEDVIKMALRQISI